MEKKIVTKYGLFTTISMVVGIVIGSGIFFKADDILISTNGSVSTALLAFIFVGVGVVFSALVISQYAIASPEKGGIITYSKMILGPKYEFLVGWTMISIYFPALLVILAFVTSTYVGIFVGNTSHVFIMSATFFIIIFSYTVNMLNPLLAGSIQKITTIIKLIPLILIAILGFGFSGTTTETASIVGNNAVMNAGGFLSSLVLIAFTFDGWIVSTSISAEIKDSKRNLPKALFYGVLVILVVYILYFIGIVNMLGADQIITLGDDYITTAGTMIFGAWGAKLIVFAVIVSVYGGLNGMTLAYFRLPQEFASQGAIKNAFNMKEINTKSNLSRGSILFTIPFIVFFFILQFIASTENSLLYSIGFDISSIPIILNYIFYTILYFGVIKFIKLKKTSKIYYLFIVLATMTSVIIIYGSFQGNGLLYLLCSFIIIILGIPLYSSSKNINISSK